MTVSSKTKKSIVLSGLVGTGGFFIAKAIGLLYSIPLSSILGSDAYMSYYGTALAIYTYFLNVFTAGFPNAVATLVAKYDSLKNYRAVLQVNRLSLIFMVLAGFLGMAVFMGLSGVIAPVVAESAEAVSTVQTVLILLSFALFFVPILSAIRGFIQGMKEFQEYAFSQSFEQIFRVGFLLSVSCVAVYAFGMARVWALYAAVLSTSVAAVAGIVQIWKYSKRPIRSLNKKAKTQTEKTIPVKPLFKEFFLLAMPYLFTAILGYSSEIYNSILLPLGLKNSFYTAAEVQTVLSGVNFIGTKLISIPMVISPGFTSAIIPHITSAIAEKKHRLVQKDIRECVSIVLFLASFLSFCILIYAAPLTHSLFYTSNLPLTATTIRWLSLEGFMGTLTPIVTSLMMAVGFRKSLIRRMVIGTVLKGILLVPMTMWLGVAGMALSTGISFGYIVLFNLMELGRRFKFSYRPTIKIFILTCIGLGAMWIVCTILNVIGIGTVHDSRLITVCGLAVNGIISSLVFLFVENYAGVLHALFHIRIGKKKKVRHA